MKVIILSLLAVVLASGCTAGKFDFTESDPVMKLIAGSENGGHYIRFNRTHYQESLAEGKVIHLYFYANWCPICAEERPKIFAAYDRLNYSDVVGYEVHYNDNEVTNDDLYITRFYQIPYQHSTVIIDKEGVVSFKSFAAIGTERLISEIERVRVA